MAKAAFNKKRVLFTSKMDLELRKKLVQCYIFGSCIIHIVHTGCANIKKKSGAKGLTR
jgi:hypothetical protein